MPPSARTTAILEPAGEIKFGQVGIANLRLKRLDAEMLTAELARKVSTAPKLFDRAPIVLDLGHLTQLPDADTTRGLLHIIRTAGLRPVGLAYGTNENETLARALDLPIFAKFRAAYEHADGELPATPPDIISTSTTASPPSGEDTRAITGQHHAQPVRSGQQVYARGRDLVLTAPVGNGAEVIADGSIHVYASLRGKAIAGARGDATARIFCQDFQAELVSIAGRYRVLEDIPADLRGKSVQAWLDGDKLLLARLGS